MRSSVFSGLGTAILIVYRIRDRQGNDSELMKFGVSWCILGRVIRTSKSGLKEEHTAIPRDGVVHLVCPRVFFSILEVKMIPTEPQICTHVSARENDLRGRESGLSCQRRKKKHELPLLATIGFEEIALERAYSRQKPVKMLDFSEHLKTRVPPAG